MGILLILFSLYNLVRPKLPSMTHAGRIGMPAPDSSMAWSVDRPGWPAL